MSSAEVARSRFGHRLVQAAAAASAVVALVALSAANAGAFSRATAARQAVQCPSDVCKPVGTGWNDPSDALPDHLGNLYVADLAGGNGTLWRLDRAGKKTTVATGIGSTGSLLAWGDPDTIYGTNYGTVPGSTHEAEKYGDLWKANVRTGKLTHIPVQGITHPSGIVLDTPTTAYVTADGATPQENALYRVDLTTGDATQLQSGFASVAGLTLDRTRGWILVTVPGAGETGPRGGVAAYDKSTGQLKGAWPVAGANNIEVDGKGTAYVTGGTLGQVYSLNLDSGAVQPQVTGLKSAWSVHMDVNTTYVTDIDGNHVYKITSLQPNGN
ncbi:hypothetical protein ACFXKR_39660 [Streptomyces violascens]|uniref:hypothetical protein n=1 Tax=Streptomyces violascens TaxID=67381 RepID=UPI0036B5FB2D